MKRQLRRGAEGWIAAGEGDREGKGSEGRWEDGWVGGRMDEWMDGWREGGRDGEIFLAKESIAALHLRRRLLLDGVHFRAPSLHHTQPSP